MSRELLVESTRNVHKLYSTSKNVESTLQQPTKKKKKKL